MQKITRQWMMVLCLAVFSLCVSVVSAQERVSVEKVEPVVAGPGERITIKGSGFSLRPEENVVEFNEIPADRPKVGEDGKTLSVQIPSRLESGKNYLVSVTVKGVKAPSAKIIEVKEQGFLNEMAAAIDEFLRRFADNALGFFSALAGISVLAMAIIETVKGILPVHRWFNSHRVSKVWLAPNARRAGEILQDQ